LIHFGRPVAFQHVSCSFSGEKLPAEVGWREGRGEKLKLFTLTVVIEF